MSTFIQQQQLNIHPFKDENGKYWWAVSSDFGFILGADQEFCDGVLFIVPQGFLTDLGSIPAWMRWLFNPAASECARAYVLHDYLNRLTAGQPPGPGVWSSQIAASVLYEALAFDGVPFWSRLVQTLGVFLGIAKAER